MLGAAAVLAIGAAGVYGASALGGHDAGDLHRNMRLLSNYDDKGDYRVGTDLAFWGERMIAGNLDQGTGPNASPPGGFRIMDISTPSEPREIGQYVCAGDQSDVSIWEDVVVTSVDKPAQEFCTPEETTERKGDAVWEGLRLVSIEDPDHPEILETVRTRCGSHTHTIQKRGDSLFVYVLSYPLAGRYNPGTEMVPLEAGGPGCNAADHGIMSVVEVPLSNPARSSVIRTESVRPSIGCHDVTVFEERQIAAAACLTESQIWDVSNPANPKVIAHIPNPEGMDLSHSTTFSNDGGTLVIGAELGGAVASPGCYSGSTEDPLGGLFFYNVNGKQKRSPEFLDSFKLPQRSATLLCTAHQFNVVPRRDRQDTLISSWYTGATSVIDFTDVRRGGAPRQVAYYIPEGAAPPPAPDEDTVGEAAAWASYWYRGHVYSSNFDEDVNSVIANSRGLDVFSVKHPAVANAIDLDRLNPQVQEPLP